jgi:hypothetical protein
VPTVRNTLPNTNRRASFIQQGRPPDGAELAMTMGVGALLNGNRRDVSDYAPPSVHQASFPLTGRTIAAFSRCSASCLSNINRAALERFSVSSSRC